MGPACYPALPALLGNCAGDCLLPGAGQLCIHLAVPARPFRERVRTLGTRRFWLRVFGGVRGS